MENKRYILMGILAVGCVQSAFGMTQSSGNQPNGNQPNRPLLPLAYTAPQKLKMIQKEIVNIFTVNLAYDCVVKIVVASVATNATMKSIGNGGNGGASTQRALPVVNRVVSQQFICPPGTSFNQISEALLQLSSGPINGLPEGISVSQLALNLLQLISTNPLL